jgi:hypothetical protein
MVVGKFLTKSFVYTSLFNGLLTWIILQNVTLNTFADCIWFSVPILINAALIFFSNVEKVPFLAHGVIWFIMPSMVSLASSNYIASFAIIFLSLIYSSLLYKVAMIFYNFKILKFDR